MRAFSTTGLVLLVALSSTAGSAFAQANPYSPSLLPWPNAAPISGPYSQASYFANPAVATDPNGIPPYNGGVPYNVYTGNPTVQPSGTLEDALHAPCCDECQTCNACGPIWVAGAAGLVMGRNRANPYWTTFESSNNANQVMNTQNAGADWAGGGMFTVGVMPCGYCGPSILFTYWGMGPMTGESTFVAGNGITAISTPINLDTQFGPVTINGVPAANYFDGAARHTINRSDNYHDFELNGLTPFLSYGRLQLAGLAGIRYLRFSDSLLFTGENFAGETASLGFQSVNNLFGVQVGGLINWQAWDRVGFFVLPKAGIFGNQMNGQTLLYSDINNPEYNILAHKTDVSVIGELDAGLSYWFASNWMAFVGYRVVGISNVALADNQFLPYLADTAGFAQVKQNGGLILHGAFFGAGFMF